MIWKRLNFTSGNRVKKTPGINQLKSSLEHSLRIVQKDDLEFNKDLIDKNIVFSITNLQEWISFRLMTERKCSNPYMTH